MEGGVEVLKLRQSNSEVDFEICFLIIALKIPAITLLTYRWGTSTVLLSGQQNQAVQYYIFDVDVIGGTL